MNRTERGITAIAVVAIVVWAGLFSVAGDGLGFWGRVLMGGAGAVGIMAILLLLAGGERD